MQKIVKFWKSGAVGKIVVIVGLLLLVCICCSAFSLISTSSPTYKATATARAAVRATELAEPTNTLSPTETPMPTNTPSAITALHPTDTPVSTNTLAPTETPESTKTPAATNTPTPIDTPQKSELFCLGQAETPEEMELEQQLSDILSIVERIDGKRVCAYRTDNNELIVYYASFDVAPIGALPILNMEFVDIMKIVHESNIPYDELFITATLPFESENGVEERMILSTIYSKYYVDSVNYNAYPDVLEDGETLIRHPSLGD